MLDIYAKDSDSDSAFIKTIYDRFKNRDDHSFSATGFKEPFIDRGDSPNQVRHATGAITFGFAGGVTASILPQGTWPDALGHTIAAFNEREKSYAYYVTPPPFPGVTRVPLPPTQSQQADMNLNGVAVPIGFWLGTGTVKRTDVGNLVRERICN